MDDDKILDLLSPFKYSFKNLPRDVILKIFSLIERKHYFDLALVCKHWFWVVSDPKLWRYIDINQANISNENIQHILGNRYMPLVCNMKLSGCVINPKAFADIAKRCDKIRNLSLTDCKINPKINFDLIKDEFEPISFSKDLVRIDVRNFGNGFVLLHLILTNSTCEKLECFGLGAHNSFKCPPFNGFKNFIPRLSNLRVFECLNFNLMDDEGIKLIGESMPNLEYLGIAGCQMVHGSTLDILLKGCPKLSTLILSGTRINDSALLSVDWSSTLVDELDLSFCENINSIGLYSILSKLNHLKYLRLDGCGKGKAFNDDFLDSCGSENFLANIQVLSLKLSLRLSLKFSKTSLFSNLFIKFSQLQELSLRSCPMINPSDITSIFLESMPNLRFFEIGNLFDEPKKFSGSLIACNTVSDCNENPVELSGSHDDLQIVLYSNLSNLDRQRSGGAVRFLYLLSDNNPLLEHIIISNRYCTTSQPILNRTILVDRDDQGAIFRSIIRLLNQCRYISTLNFPNIDVNSQKIINYALSYSKFRESKDSIITYSNSPIIPNISVPSRSLDAELRRVPFK